MRNTSNPGVWLAWTLPAYLLTLVLIGWSSRARKFTANQFLNASASLPTWAVAVAFLAYNCGSTEILGISAMAAQYGVQALHFYWIGGIPGLVFLSLVVLPIYLKTGARSLPEYFELRFGSEVRLLSACLSAFSTAAFAGVALFGLAEVLHVILGWTVGSGTLLGAGVVLGYVLAGGVRTTVYASVFQFLMLLAGVAPLIVLAFRHTPWTFAQSPARWHLWSPLPMLNPHAPLDCIGVSFGLGLVISFSYWCTDFVMLQRALAARSFAGAQKVPLLAGLGKMMIAFLIVLPAVDAPLRMRPASLSFNEVLPSLLKELYSPTLLAFGATALAAGLMAGVAGNVSGFAALWTEEIYRPSLVRGKSERHYLWVGKAAIAAGVLLSIVGAYLAFHFHDLMEFLQLIVALFYAPVFAVVLAAVFTARLQSRGAILAILAGIVSGLAIQIAYWKSCLAFGSQMTANFYTAILEFLVASACCVFGRTSRKCPRTVTETVFRIRPDLSIILLSACLLTVCLLLNLLWW